MNAIKERLLGLIKDKHAMEQCTLANSLVTNEQLHISNESILRKIQKYNIINDSILCKTISCDVPPSVYKDIEFHETIFSNIQQCSLVGGQLLSKHLHSNPISAIDILQQRAVLLQNIEATYLLHKQQIDEYCDTLKEKEKYVIWMFDEQDANIQDIYNIVFFRWKKMKALNKLGGALTTYNLYRILVSPLVGIFSPIIYFIIPYLVIVYKFKVKISFFFYVKTLISSILTMDTVFGQNKFLSYFRIVSYLFSAVFYFQGIFSSIDLSTTCNKISSMLIENLNNVITYIETAQRLFALCWNEQYNVYFDISTSDPIDNFLLSLSRKDYSLFGNFGKQLRDYKILRDEKTETLTKLLRKTYMVDCILGTIKYKLSRGFCYNIVNTSLKPIIEIQDMCHPSISTSKTVPNSIQFGDKFNGRNAIITSPNSSGKSVLIKSIVANVLLSQTSGICCASKSMMTPFAFINTQINVPDSTGFESLFEAEMHRCKKNLDKLNANQDYR